MYKLYRALFAIIRFFTFGKCRVSRPTEGNAATMQLRDMLIWAYKYYGEPATQPEPGKGIIEHFATHGIEGFAQGALHASGRGGSPVASIDDTGTTSSISATSSHPVSNNFTDHTERLTIALAGDILPSPYMHAECTRHLFDAIQKSYFSADIRYANFESPLCTDKPAHWPNEDMTAPPRMNNHAEAFDICYQEGKGINIFSTANNHSLDQGEAGLLATLDFLDAKGAAYVGTARTQEQHDDPPILEAKGIKVAFLSYTFSLNREVAPADKPWLVNHLRLNLPNADIATIARAIRIAREQKGADVVVVCPHWGLEYESWPMSSQVATAHRIIEAGADIIAGNHPHSLQPAERHVWHDSTGHEHAGLIVYALGDLISDMPDKALTGLTAIVRVELERATDGQVDIISAELRPLYSFVAQSSDGQCEDYRLLDFVALKQRLSRSTNDEDELRFTNKQRQLIAKLSETLKNIHPYSTQHEGKNR
jgi:poly-gamma-glutamate synthesis protein (capsule biosynthesis protein)